MARRGAGNSYSATSRWFVHLADNRTNLDHQNGGFTVFGRVAPRSVATVDRIAALLVVDAWAARPRWARRPGRWASCRWCAARSRRRVAPLRQPARSTSATLRTVASNAARIFDELQAARPGGHPSTAVALARVGGYTHRHDAATGPYVDARSARVYCLMPLLGAEITSLGSATHRLAVAATGVY